MVTWACECPALTPSPDIIVTSHISIIIMVVIVIIVVIMLPCVSLSLSLSLPSSCVPLSQPNRSRQMAAHPEPGSA